MKKMQYFYIFLIAMSLCLFKMANAAVIGSANYSSLVIKTSDNQVTYEGGNQGNRLQMVLMFSNDPSKETTVSSNCETACTDPFVRLGDKCYHFNTARVTWYEAFFRCHKLGASLAHPEDKNEDEDLRNKISSYNTGSSWWMGGTDEAKEDEWIWAHSGKKIQYVNWFTVSPNGKTKENCLVYYHTPYTWDDHNCNDHKLPFVCQNK